MERLSWPRHSLEQAQFAQNYLTENLLYVARLNSFLRKYCKPEGIQRDNLHATSYYSQETLLKKRGQAFLEVRLHRTSK